MSFFSSESVPSSEVSRMSIGEMYHRIRDGEISVPDYQREYVWSSRQQQAYLESISRGLPLFGPVININTNNGMEGLMDGQNRLYTIYKFMNCEISFETESGDEIKYSELSDHEKRKFKNTKISYIETRNWTREQCQEFFMIIQEGVKLKDGELIHAKPTNPFTQQIVNLFNNHQELFMNKSDEGGIGLTPSITKRYGHYEIIGTIIHMTRTLEYPVRPGKTALKEFKLWDDENTPTQTQRDTCVRQANDCLSKYSDIVVNVPRLKTKLKKEEHLRLLYFIYKSGLYNQNWTDTEYTKLENLLNRVLNKENPEYQQIITWGTGNAENIYNLYLNIFNI